MAANSASSAESGKSNTSKTGNLTPEMALEILATAIIKCREAGIDARMAPFFGNNAGNSVAIILAGVDLVDGRLLPVTASNGAG